MKVWLVILASWGGHPAAIKQMPGEANLRVTRVLLELLLDGPVQCPRINSIDP